MMTKPAGLLLATSIITTGLCFSILHYEFAPELSGSHSLTTSPDHELPSLNTFKHIDPTTTGIYTAGHAVQRTESLLSPEPNPPASAPEIRDDVPGLTLLRYERRGFTNLQVGERIVLSLPGSESEFDVWIESRHRHPSGSLTLNGKVNGKHEHSFVMTIGSNATFATISTESGIYNLRGNRQHLWIASGRSFNHHVDGSVLDYRIADPANNQETKS